MIITVSKIFRIIILFERDTVKLLAGIYQVWRDEYYLRC